MHCQLFDSKDAPVAAGSPSLDEALLGRQPTEHAPEMPAGAAPVVPAAVGRAWDP